MWAFRGRLGGLLTTSLLTATAAMAADVPYGVADKPWAEELGNHRAVVRVDQKAEAVLVRIPWRRRDYDADKKDIIVIDAATGNRIVNVARLSVDREVGVLAFEPPTAPGEYFVYYLPYQPQPGWGGYDRGYFSPNDTAQPAWRQRLPGRSRLPQAKVLRFEARTEFDSFYPMEVVATTEETRQFLQKNPQPYLLFPEDRRYPIRMTDDLPRRWISGGPSLQFHGEAMRNEYYAFQVGVYAAGQALDDIEVGFSGDCANWLKCFNVGGIGWDGRPFRKTVNVPQGKVQALWFGVDVPGNVKAGEYRGTVTLRPRNAVATTVALTFNILPTALGDRGDSELWRYSRLRWLDSTLGSDDDVVAPYTPLQVKGQTVICLGRTVGFARSGLPESLCAGDTEILAGPMQFVVETESGPITLSAAAPRLTKQAAGVVVWEASSTGGPLSVRTVATMEFDGHIGFTFRINAKQPLKVKDIRLEIPLRRDAATYMMGIGRAGGYRPAEYTWKWQGPYDSFWIGDVHAGLHCEFRGGSYHGPLLNLYHPAPPASWHNGGQGGVTIANATDNQALVRAFSGPRDLAAGQDLTFEFALLVTPVKPLDPTQHFRERYYHGGAAPKDEAIAAGVKLVNIHHATPTNPYINYPFITVDRMQALAKSLHEKGVKLKIYYTLRELTSRVGELWALRSLGDEILAGGGGGGFPWLREHLLGGYTPQWYTVIEGGGVDAAILNSGASRWYNYYVESLGWLSRNIPIDGLYLDDVSYDRTILKRMRKVMERERPGCRIDLHSNTGFSIGPANQYAEFFPYVDSIWFGESFDYEAMPPDQWLVEVSGIPFGLMGEMLMNDGNPWRGMVYGMTRRHSWNDPLTRLPVPLWNLWDEFGIAEARMIGYWEKNCPIRTDQPNVLATAYVRKGKTLIALASWEKQKVQCQMKIDWKALGLDPAKASLVAPAVGEFQESRSWKPADPIPVDPGRGWLILVQ